MSALTVVETDLACRRRDARGKKSVSLTNNVHNPRVFTRQLERFNDLGWVAGPDEEDWIELPANPRVTDTVYTYKIRSHENAIRERKASSPATERWRDRHPRPATTTDRIRTNARGKFQRIVRSTIESIATVAIDRDRSQTRRTRGSVSRRHPIDRQRSGIVSPPRVGCARRMRKKYSMKYVLGPWSP